VGGGVGQPGDTCGGNAECCSNMCQGGMCN
jgi:hypothetical protein